MQIGSRVSYMFKMNSWELIAILRESMPVWVAKKSEKLFHRKHKVSYLEINFNRVNRPLNSIMIIIIDGY